MVDNIRMEYNISIQRCYKLILLHKTFLLQGQGAQRCTATDAHEGDCRSSGTLRFLAYPYPFEKGKLYG
ncbi:hypothetical protein [Flagellimonas algicola]|uniref:Uncharacterized protein n=1 Tax=Flagellimonas algicola TaxID=2583815 RepID=A0ABY2WGS1_9FLAO|nr:hypothetical protein [Allomuricauda algicola]TMU50764.1 hypothetical protein FGG15_18375 [Allomuricauda algicola]